MQTQVHGGDIYTREYCYDFFFFFNPFGMLESVKKAAMEGVTNAVCYPDIECRQLRSAISTKEHVAEEWILCGNGAAELLFSLVTALRPRKALLVSPGFAEYEQALKTTKCDIEFYRLKKENGFRLDENYLDALSRLPDIAFLCSPNNPTGLLIDSVLLEKIILKCQENNIFLVLDECFLEFVSEELQNSGKKHLSKMQNLFILKAFTKMYGMPGLRLGYGLCSDTRLLYRMKQMMQPWNVSMPAQMAGIAACKETEFAKKTRDYIEKERRYLYEQLNKLHFEIYPSYANYLFFEAPEDLYEICQRESILIRDCSNYRGLSNGYYRIAVKLHEDNEQLIRILEKYYG